MSAPVLFLVFNRPATTARVFQKIKEYQPRQLFVAADGPRNPAEAALCEEVRSIVRQVDWDCEVNYLLREKNLGCRAAVSEGISWFFSKVDRGIILEDDCLPDRSFFTYCETLLEKYYYDPKITVVSGSNHLFDKKYGTIDGYFFTTYCNIWGWATWKRVIEKVEWYPSREKLHLNEGSFSEYLVNRERLSAELYQLLIAVLEERFNTWDVVLFYNLFLMNGVNIAPVKNLISNIGVEGTHAQRNAKDLSLLRPLNRIDMSRAKAVTDPYDTHHHLNETMMIEIENIFSPQQTILSAYLAKVSFKLRRFFT